MPHHTQKWTDEQILSILDRHERGRESAAEIARTYGVSRSSILGIIFRVNADTDRAERAPLPFGYSSPSKPENLDGGMPPRWWKNRRRAA